MDTWLIILIVVISLLFIGIIAYLLLNRHHNKDKESIKEYPSILLGLGGKENVELVTKKGTRISIQIKDSIKIDKDKIKQAGITTIVLTTTKVTIAANNDLSESIYSYLQSVVSE